MKSASQPRSVPLPVNTTAPQIDESVWYAKGLRFECTQCGNCCTGGPGYVWLTEDDMTRIAEYLKMPFDQFTRTYVRRISASAARSSGGGATERYSLTEKFNYDCTFLTRDKDGKSGCMIYPVRPMQCRTWPFWDDNLKSPEAWRRASTHCPGMCDAGAAPYPLEHIETCRQHPESPH